MYTSRYKFLDHCTEEISFRVQVSDISHLFSSNIKILIIEWKIISTCLSCPRFSIGHPVLIFKPSGFPLNTLRE